jgi:MFS family permease
VNGEVRLGMVLAAASMAMFATNLDFFALNLSIPGMARELDSSTTNMQWVISGFMLALGSFLIPGGRLGDILGRKRVLIAGTAIEEILRAIAIGSVVIAIPLAFAGRAKSSR